MAQKQLDRPDVGPIGEQVRREGVAKRVHAGVLHDIGHYQCIFEGPLHSALGGMPAKPSGGFRASALGPGREDELPRQAAGGTGILTMQGPRKRRMPSALGQVVLVERGHSQQMLLQRGPQPDRQQACSIFAALATADVDGSGVKVQVFHPQGHCLGDPQSGPIKQLGHEARGPREVGQHVPDFTHRQDRGQSSLALDTPEPFELANVDLQDVSVQKEDRVERLRLRGRGYLLVARQVVDEGSDAVGADRNGVLLGMEVDVAPDPVAVGLFRSPAEVPTPADLGDAIHEALGLG